MTAHGGMVTRMLPWAGCVLGPGAWLANTQLGQVLPYAECGGDFRASLLFSGLGIGLSVLGAYASWRGSALRGAPTRPFAFIGSLGALLGLLFAFALLLQGAAAMVLTGCER